MDAMVFHAKENSRETPHDRKEAAKNLKRDYYAGKHAERERFMMDIAHEMLRMRQEEEEAIFKSLLKDQLKKAEESEKLSTKE